VGQHNGGRSVSRFGELQVPLLCLSAALTSHSHLFHRTSSGVEYFYGFTTACSDFACEDFRSRANIWKQSRYALEFFSEQFIPFQTMVSANSRISGGNWLLADPSGDVLVAYLRNGGSASVDLSDFGDAKSAYLENWYDPRNGGRLHYGSLKLLPVGEAQQLGEAPYEPEQDWVVLLRKCDDCLPLETGTEAWVIAVLAIGGFVAIVLAVYGLHHRLSKRKPTLGVSDKDSRLEMELEYRNETTFPGETTASASSMPTEILAAEHNDSVVGEVAPTVRVPRDPPTSSGTPTSSAALPEFKDQVRSASRDYIPTVAAIQVEYSVDSGGSGGVDVKYARVEL